MSNFRNVKLSKIVLMVSLAVNLAVLGMVAGAWLGGNGGHRDRDVRGGGPRWSAGPYGQALSPEDRREMGARFRGVAAQTLRDRRDASRQAALEMVDALLADPYENAAVAEILQRQLEIGTSQRAIGHQILREQIASMTPSERVAFAARLQEALARRRPSRD